MSSIGAVGRLTRGVAASVWLILAADASAQDHKCLFVSSYHQGYAWSDGVERGLRKALGDKCELRQFDMDTKRLKGQRDKVDAALAAKALIEQWQPDVVITADDNAAKYLIKPYYRDAGLPFVFCGVNWTVKEYGFPYRNVTGMIEVAPVRAMVEEAVALVPDAQRVMYVGANTATERKNAERMRKVVEGRGLVFERRLASSLESWVEAYTKAQDYDFVIMGSNAGINDWNADDAVSAIVPLTRRLSVTNHGWMMSVSMLGMTKVPEEQGEWAGRVASRILDGASPDTFPVIANRKWDLFLNPALIDAAGVQLPERLARKGKVYQ